MSAAGCPPGSPKEPSSGPAFEIFAAIFQVNNPAWKHCKLALQVVCADFLVCNLAKLISNTAMLIEEVALLIE
jgi:hypothetical protein